MFEIDVAGLAQLEGGDSHRLACEPVANVFDEFRGYGETATVRKRPSFCAATLTYQPKPRGVVLVVADDGAGFANEKDIWTLFGHTEKRADPKVAGRFNAGDKQLIATSRLAVIETNALTVNFFAGKRSVTRHREPLIHGTRVELLMPWSMADMDAVKALLESVLPPDGLDYTVNGKPLAAPNVFCVVSVALPTIVLDSGFVRQTIRKATVRVIKSSTPTLYELGIPVCSLADVGFPWSLDVCQKVPVPLSRNTVSPQYLFRLIGSVIEFAAVDGITLLTEEEQGAGFIRGALDWIREPEALTQTVKSLFGANAVRQSSDPIANAQAAAAGAAIVPGRWFSTDTRRRMDQANALPTASTVYAGSAGLRDADNAPPDREKCPHCDGRGWV